MTVTMPQNATLIDTLGEGYRAINRRPLLLAVPVSLNLYLWFSTQLSFAPLLADWQRLMERMSGASQPSTQSSLETLEVLGTLDMRQLLAVLNSIPMLPVAPVIGLGSTAAQALEVRSMWAAMLAFVLVNAVALPLSAGFLTRMAEVVRGERTPLPLTLGRALRAGLSILGAASVIAGVGLALVLPFLVFSLMLSALSAAIGAFAISLVMMALFWAWVYLNFANEAIVIGGLNPLRALHASFNIVRRNFWGTVGLLALSFLITTGCAVIWRQLIGTTAGLVIAILGSAYIGCGLQAARMVFFQERLRHWQGVQKPR